MHPGCLGNSVKLSQKWPPRHVCLVLCSVDIPVSEDYFYEKSKRKLLKNQMYAGMFALGDAMPQ